MACMAPVLVSALRIDMRRQSIDADHRVGPRTVKLLRDAGSAGADREPAEQQATESAQAAPLILSRAVPIS